MGDLEFISFKNNVIMNQNKKSPFTPFEVHSVNSSGKVRRNDSPTSSILKTPTAIFVTTRNSSAKTKRLKFANGPVDLKTLRNGSHESNDSNTDTIGDRKLLNNGEVVSDDNIVEVAISPVKTMQVSPESWKAFLEYKKFSDYPNETEKTDYTYSRLSKFRHKEIIPGFLIRPNLSRSSISSRRSSLSLPGSLSFSEESYQFKNDHTFSNQSNSETNYDFKTPSQSNTVSRSKYYLRSTSFDDADINEVGAKPYYFEKEYNRISEPEFTKKTVHYTTSEIPESSSHYSTKVRSMEYDDADLDEVDDHPVQYEKYYSSKVGAKLSKGRSQTVSQYFSNFFASIFTYVTLLGTGTKDLFSKYILRRQDDSSYLSMSRSWRNDNLGYATSSGSWIPWSNERSYSSMASYSDRGLSSSWYQRFYYYFRDRILQITNLFWSDNKQYVSSRYYETSRRRKFWWLLIPLLLLAGFWLFKAEQENGFLTSQYKEWDCKTNGLLTSMENTIKPLWRSAYVTYKRAANSASCYVNDSWEKLKLPFTHIGEGLHSRISYLSNSSYGFIFNFLNALWEGLCSIFNFFCKVFSILWMFFFDLAIDFISAVNNVLRFIYEYLMDVFFNTANGFAWIFDNVWKVITNALHSIQSYFLLLLTPKGHVEYQTPVVSDEACIKQNSIDKLTAGMADFKAMSWDLSAIKKKINELELEFKKEKESRKNQDDLYSQQMEQNHKLLQEYKAKVDQALISSKKSVDLSTSSLQYYLDNQSETLKQWITQNFLLKSNSPDINEEKIALVIAKYSNRTGEDLLALRREFEKFVLNHKSELQSLRNEYSAIGTNNMATTDVSLTYIKKLIGDAIKLYDADKTGRVDYALETAGGQVLSIRCTETYIASPKSYTLLRWYVYTKTSSPRDAISPEMAAGQCWAFMGSQGFLVLKLSHTIKVTGFTMEHISKLLVPRGHIESAPKNFSMWGLKSEHDLEPYLFGEYTYLDNEETLQYFPVLYPTFEPYNIVELKITSNHGNPNYTCLYRIRVHGDLDAIQ